MANQIPPVQNNQQLVDPQTGFGRPPFILLINNFINQIVNNATGLISKFFATKPSGTAPITTSGTYGSGVTISLDDSGVSPGTYGDATHVPQITVDEYGLLSNVVPIAITGGGGGPIGEVAWKVDATGTGSPQTITIPDNNPTLQSIIVSVNGVRYDTSNYSISGTTVTLTTNASGDSIEIVGPVGDGTSSPFLVTGTGTGSPQNLTLPMGGLTPQTCLVYVNGIRQPISLYSIVAATLTLTTNASGDSIEIVGPLGTAQIGVGPKGIFLGAVTTGPSAGTYTNITGATFTTNLSVGTYLLTFNALATRPSGGGARMGYLLNGNQQEPPAGGPGTSPHFSTISDGDTGQMGSGTWTVTITSAGPQTFQLLYSDYSSASITNWYEINMYIQPLGTP